MLQFVRGIQVLAILAATAMLVIAVWIRIIAPSWIKTPERTDAETFLHGAIGAEIMPLPVFQVLPDMFPDRFQPAGPEAGDWIDQFGFVRGDAEQNDGLPVGWARSNYQPKSGAPSPVEFVGFSCGLCHTAVIRTDDGSKDRIVYGMGNNSLDLFAWLEAFLGSLLDERMTLDNIDEAYRNKFGRSLNFTERSVVRLYLRNAQAGMRDAVTKWDDPYPPDKIRDSLYMPNGPSRTQAFRELVRVELDRPAATDRAISKLPPLWHQENREWAQVDGSVRNPLSRSVFAALAAGSTTDNLIKPGIFKNVGQDIDYVMTLDGPNWEDIFPEYPIEAEQTERGKIVYMQHCNDCHGHRDPETGKWVKGSDQGKIVPLEKIGTDPYRVNYRHYDELPDIIFERIPDDSPIKPKREDLRPGPLGKTKGYINAPLESLFTRVPYLHNGSVLTLAELINLKPRRDVFYRGRNFYDIENVGLHTPDKPDAKRYYRFDVSRPGNSNVGHDYPWPYRGAGWDEAALKDLLEYLKTL